MNDQSRQPDSVLVVVPAHNEAPNLAMVLDGIQQYGSFDVVVVDDNSIDETRAIALKHGAAVLPLVIRLGAWGAIQTGIRYGLLSGYEIIVTIDADGQHDPGDIPKLLEEMKHGEADVVIGSCPDRGSPARHAAWKIFQGLSGLMFEDLTSGLKVYGKQASLLLADADATIFDYQDLGVLLFLMQGNMVIKERKVVMSHRADGKSRIFDSWFLVLKYMMQTIILCFSMRNFKKPLPGRSTCN
jgi:glycosyltransferase involved in cell wall biosynthesis